MMLIIIQNSKKEHKRLYAQDHHEAKTKRCLNGKLLNGSTPLNVRIQTCE